ncbi:Uncharacterized protein DB41_CR00080 [Neochlamydia sp. TUME1]|uniref:hypothetical protein n=1 Tax=Neochlamydia sp. TUME1 TaxID=1478174 RepID=UPI0005804460|nr:hypothetical protein [Neochlamydia sp. TUME1]KIC77214.1 Uncharacterized protein DB41_CR00080 [Neochlamydia sp. TUME1]
MFEEESFSLSPVNFFQLKGDCHYAPKGISGQKYLLADTSYLCGEEHFSKVSLGWNEQGLECLVAVSQPFKQAYHPDVSRGDSVELMIDTRDVKTSGFNTRFCHHFFFLPEAVDGIQAGEMTRFRTEDKHELCDANELKVNSQLSSQSYTLKIFIPSHCLVGYDPEQFDRLGFTYRVNRKNESPQHFSVVTRDFQIEQQPSLWSSLSLVK